MTMLGRPFSTEPLPIYRQLRDDMDARAQIPPGVPSERLKALQDAFVETLKDAATLADAENVKLDPNPVAETERIVNSMLSLPPDLAARLADIRKG